MTKSLAGISTILLVLTIAHAQEKPAAPPADGTAATILANERALYDAVAKGDRTAFLSLAELPEGVWTSKSGFIPMEILKDHLDGFKLTKWDIVNPHVTPLGSDSAVVLYAWTGAGTFNGQPVPPTTLASTVWTKRNGQWRAFHHQETELVK